MSSIPEAEKFAKFWVCKAKLLASKGSFDAIGLYQEAIQNGAAVSICLGWLMSNSLSWAFFVVCNNMGLYCTVKLPFIGVGSNRVSVVTVH